MPHLVFNTEDLSLHNDFLSCCGCDMLVTETCAEDPIVGVQLRDPCVSR
jgi:hypothetical protein